MISIDFFLYTYKVLIGVVSITVGRIDNSIFHGLLDNVPHVLDILDGHRHELLQQMSVRMFVKEKRSLPVLVQNVYLSVLQVPVDILDQLPHCFLQAPEQLLLSVKYFISHLWKWSIVP